MLIAASKAISLVGCLSLLILLIPTQSSYAHPLKTYVLHAIRPNTSEVGSIRLTTSLVCNVPSLQQNQDYIIATTILPTFEYITRFSAPNCQGERNPNDLYASMDQASQTVSIVNW